MQLRSTRLSRRIWQHHLGLFVLSTVCVATLYATRPFKDVLTRASFATAYPALALLALSLILGPWNVLRGARNPISSDLRRDIGIWAGFLSLLHTAVGQNVHLRGRPWLYYVYSAQEHHHSFPLRHDLFGLANYTGAVSALLVIALLATSNDYSLRKLGTPRWKTMQRWNYFLFALAGIHSFAYQGVEKQKLHFVLTVVACVLIALVFQLAGVAARRKAASA